MKDFLKLILVIFIFLFFQFVGTAIAMIYSIASTPECVKDIMNGNMLLLDINSIITSNVISASLIISSLLTIACLYLFKFVNRKTVFCATDIKWKWAPIVVFGAFAGIFATNMMMEWVELPDLLGEKFVDMSKTAIGIITIGVLGPIVEELTFREAFIRQVIKIEKFTNEMIHLTSAFIFVIFVFGGGIFLLKLLYGIFIFIGAEILLRLSRFVINHFSISKWWVAIFLSALCFGLIHGNPAQIPFAFLIGLVLAIVYYKTGNIVLSSIIHILNNSIAVIQMNVLGEHANDFTFKDILGFVDIPVIIALSLFCIFILYKFWHNYTSNI